MDIHLYAPSSTHTHTHVCIHTHNFLLNSHKCFCKLRLPKPRIGGVLGKSPSAFWKVEVFYPQRLPLSRSAVLSPSSFLVSALAQPAPCPPQLAHLHGLPDSFYILLGSLDPVLQIVQYLPHLLDVLDHICHAEISNLTPGTQRDTHFSYGALSAAHGWGGPCKVFCSFDHLKQTSPL